MRSFFVSAAVAASLLVSIPAHAQLVGQRGGATMASFVGIHAFGIVEMERMAAQNSFDAVLAGSSESRPMLFGAGVDVERLWKGVFVRFAATRATNTGSRVFVDSSKKVHSLNVPLTIALTPIEVGGGWRFGRGKVKPYVGAALLFQRYEETSTGASASENVKATDGGLAFFGGVDVAFGVLRVGGEGFYRSVPVESEAPSVLADFSEDNLGGVGFRILFGVGF
jgi:hypothetical protein